MIPLAHKWADSCYTRLFDPVRPGITELGTACPEYNTRSQRPIFAWEARIELATNRAVVNGGIRAFGHFYGPVDLKLGFVTPKDHYGLED